jgi:hypothetical protein
MGIRIHKAIGYGLKDLDPDIDNDPRMTYDGEKIFETDFADYQKFVENKATCVEVLVSVFGEEPNRAGFSWLNIDMALESFKRNKLKPYSNDFISYDIEDSTFVLFYPINNLRGAHNSWERYDDTIDYYENKVYNKDMDTIITDLSDHGVCGLYPYDHGMHLKPGRESKVKGHPDKMDAGFYNQLVGKWDSNIAPMANEEIINHLKEDWGPGIPSSIKLFTFYHKIFKDPLTVYELKPLLCQWWG